jgi:hypothetical protein
MEVVSAMLDTYSPSFADAAPVSRIMRKRVKGYFSPAQKWPTYLLAMGLLTGGLGWLGPHATVLVLTGLALFCLGSYYVVRPLHVGSAREVDFVALSDLNAAQQLALRAFHLETADLANEQPCRFRSMSTTRELGSAFQGSKRGKDLKQRWTPHEIAIVNFGRDQLFIYTCALDLTTGNAICVQTHEVLYQDIVSIDTQVQTKTIKLRDKDRDLRLYWEHKGARVVNRVMQLDAEQTIHLRLAAGESIQIAAWTGYRNGIQPEEVRINDFAAAHLRRMVRELKQPSIRPPSPPRIVRHTRPN